MNVEIEKVAQAISDDPRFANTAFCRLHSIGGHNYTVSQLKDDPFLGELVRYFVEGLGFEELSVCSDPTVKIRDEFLERVQRLDLRYGKYGGSADCGEDHDPARERIVGTPSVRVTTLRRVLAQKKQYDGD